jgi:hypothetical protein
LNAALAIQNLSWSLAGAVILFGCWILLTRRVFVDWIPATPHVGAVLGLAALGVTSWLTRRRAYSDRDAAAYLDWSTGSGGLFLALLERPDENWSPVLEQKLDAAIPPRPKFGVNLQRLLPGLLLVLLACLIPKFIPSWRHPVNDAGQRLIDDLQQQINALSEEELLTDEEEKSLREALARIQQDLDEGEFGSSEWEAADSIQQRLVEKTDRTMEALTFAAETVFDALQESGMDPKEWSLDQLTEAQKNLEQALKHMDTEGLLRKMSEQIDEDMLNDLVEKFQNGMNPAQGDPERFREQLKQLEAFLNERGGDLEEMLPEGDEQLLRFLKAMEDGELAQLAELARRQGGLPGQGAPNRGPGAAELDFGREPTEQQEQFLDDTLKSGAHRPDLGELLALEEDNPEVAPAEMAERGRIREFENTEQDATWNRTVTPSNRGVVRRYFDQDK